MYSTGMIYNEIKHHQQRVPWRSVVWSSRGIPRHNFLTWLMVLNRNPTKDRILNWGIATDPSCILCNASAESRDHLYFECVYSWNLWSELARRANWKPSVNWSVGVELLQSSTAPKHHRLLVILTWQASIYLIWSDTIAKILDPSPPFWNMQTLSSGIRSLAFGTRTNPSPPEWSKHGLQTRSSPVSSWWSPLTLDFPLFLNFFQLLVQ